ncbi:NAD(P) transhydrogenase subunit alpha [Halorientalis sp. IM1011]|uniref:Re/Si-specific NAD(P)(+) transhydrogenase subunit alpha n=1 Tax=Halorientalis sp. IM1011 TaxID=1932360 RepID=UPI00097CC14F|nr:Re/Si-specific NAD(P)(+) transhydrogenase subunit alpha [Halorientalis sp. IM1011]AQL44168.1 NAD(P) transhydrogenase subunit alpha [Halorientalis sp. IM1011]
MIVGVPTETADGERRVALTPSVAEDFVEDGHEVCVAAGAGAGANFADDAYEAVGCEIIDDRRAVFDRADVLFQVRGLGATETETDPYREDQIVVGLLGPYEVADETVDELASRGVSAFALELMPRISRAQSMDALSSQASLGGYQATLMAAEELPKMFPMEMTAAGTIQPAEVFVIGAGVAGLKAIATAERLGASTRGHDVRLEVKREVESLGADFVELELPTEGSGDEEGYAVEMGEEFYAEQRKQMQRVVPESDVLITTAAIPGRPAPEIVTTEMIEDMDAGSVIVDLAAETGGNCEPTEAGETVEVDGVRVHGPTDLPSRVSTTASQQYANNLGNFLDNLVDEDGELDVDLEDEIVDSTLLVHDGTVRNPHLDDGGGGGDDGDAADDSEGGDDDGD